MTSTPVEPPKKSGHGCLWGLVILVCVIVLIALSGSNDEPEDTNSVGAAKVNCHESVRKQLKAPSTAKFQDGPTSKSGNTWTVTGTVDSENSFGAMLRTSWTCSADESGGLAVLGETS